eukprot:scaffold39980_cov50-Attheya_sp.AAC.4
MKQVEGSYQSQLAEKQDQHAREVADLKQQNAKLAKATPAVPASQPSSHNSNNGGSSRAEKEELIQLRREVAEYEVEFRGLKNQDITIRKLEAKISELQENQADHLEQELKKARDELAETEGRRAAEALEREAAMELRYKKVELELRAERAGREATRNHLLEADEGAGEREAAWEAQRQILMDDSERLRETLHEATRERDQLRLKTALLDDKNNPAATGSSPHTPSRHGGPPSSGNGIGLAELMLERKAYEAEVSELSHTVNELRDELRTNELTTAEERRTMQSSLDSLQEERKTLSTSVSSLQAQLTNAPSLSVVENMKRELRILKRLEYNAVDADSEQDPEVTTSGDGNEIVGDLEAVLVAKLRRTEAELVKERHSKKEMSQKCDDLSDQVSKLEIGKVQADKLIYSLESDLQKAITTPAVGGLVSPTPRSFDSIHFPVTPGDPNVLQQIIDPTSPAVSTAVVSKPAPLKTPSSSTVSTTASEKANDDHSVATIVMAQRDRLRARCDALEAERDSFKMELQVQVQSAESLKVDNTKLYEKVRYLQNFGNKSSSSASLGAGSSSLHQRRSGGDVDLDLEALEQRYEASVDPFRQFGRTERQRKLKEMSPMERIVFIVSKTVLSSKEMRTALFFYVIGMHLLVFITTYHWSHALGCHDLVLSSSDSFAHMHGGVPLPETRGVLLEPAPAVGLPILEPPQVPKLKKQIKKIEEKTN